MYWSIMKLRYIYDFEFAALKTGEVVKDHHWKHLVKSPRKLKQVYFLYSKVIINTYANISGAEQNANKTLKSKYYDYLENLGNNCVFYSRSDYAYLLRVGKPFSFQLEGKACPFINIKNLGVVYYPQLYDHCVVMYKSTSVPIFRLQCRLSRRAEIFELFKN